jgi:hypothetical protein
MISVRWNLIDSATLPASDKATSANTGLVVVNSNRTNSRFQDRKITTLQRIGSWVNVPRVFVRVYPSPPSHPVIVLQLWSHYTSYWIRMWLHCSSYTQTHSNIKRVPQQISKASSFLLLSSIPLSFGSAYASASLLIWLATYESLRFTIVSTATKNTVETFQQHAFDAVQTLGAPGYAPWRRWRTQTCASVRFPQTLLNSDQDTEKTEAPSPPLQY